MKIDDLAGLENKIGEKITIDKTKSTLFITNKSNEKIVVVDYKLQPSSAISILEKRKFIKRID